MVVFLNISILILNQISNLAKTKKKLLSKSSSFRSFSKVLVDLQNKKLIQYTSSDKSGIKYNFKEYNDNILGNNFINYPPLSR
jgi:hypothetical protein